MFRGQKFFKSAKFRIPLLGFIGLTALTFGLKKNKLTSPAPVITSIKNTDSVPTIKNPVQSVCFVNDTLDSYASALMTYSNNNIVRYLVKNSPFHRMQLPYFVHEWWHHHNKKNITGHKLVAPYWKKFVYSPSQFMQLRMHEEISPTVMAIATADLEYQLADDKAAVIKKYENTYMEFYFRAIKDGTIKPESTDTLELDKKYSLLVNGCIQMWEYRYRDHYTPSLNFMLRQYLVTHGFHKPMAKNYRRVLSHMYTVGDVDLSKYIQNDASFPDIKLDIFDGLASVHSFKKDTKFRSLLINDIYAYADKLLYFPVHQRKAVLQHILIASKLKYELKKLNGFALEPNAQAISCAYNKVCYELAHDNSFAKFINSNSFLEKIKVPLEDTKTYFDAFGMSSLIDENHRKDIAQFYNFRHTDLTCLIKNFDINRLPTDQSRWEEFNTNYLASRTLKELIIPVPQSTYLFSTTTDIHTVADASVTGTASRKNSPSKFGKHLSKKLFANIPNFEEALLNPKALTPEVRDTLKKLFKEFNDIPAEFTNCNIKSSQRYIQLHGHPHYFEHPDAPYQAHFSSSQKHIYKNNLAILRRARQKRFAEK